VYLKLFQLSKPILDFDIVMLDEAQDSNPVTLDIFYRQVAQKIMVGDPWQAIYEWRGAINAFNTVPEDWIRLKLTESFRCTPEIAAIATKLLWIGGEDSPVVGLGKAKGDGSRAILCRTNLDILTHLLAAKNAKEKVFVMADLADLWSKLYHISSLSSGSKPKYPNKQLKMFSNMDELVKESEHNHELRKLLNFGTFLAGGIGLHANIVAIKEVVVDKQEDASYTIATCHKSKGLEFDSVVIDSAVLNLEQEDKTTAEILAEGQMLNLLYVAVTRSRSIISMPSELHEILANSGVLRGEYKELIC
jgi:superfamily I DNA/RNA helicase